MQKTLFVVALLFAALLSVAGIALAQNPGDPAAGKTAWEQQMCQNCHGAMGEGGYAGPRAGDGKSVEEWIKQARNPKANMPAFSESKVTDQELGDMNAYMQTLAKPESFTPIKYAPDAGEPAGKTLLNEKRCAACHGDGAGFVQKRFVERNREITPEIVIKQLREPAEYMPMFSTAQVSDEQARQIADFLKSLVQPQPAAPEQFELWTTLAMLEEYEWVDLTHAFAPGIPRWPGFDDAQFNTVYDYDKDGFYAQEFVHVGQYGTHMDPPAHFVKGLRFIDQIELKEMAAPLVVINVADKVAANPDYELTVEDIKAWEAKYGPVPEGAFVAMRSDWSKRFGNVDEFFNKDENGQAHYPGWTLDALKYLYEERKIGASGHEPPDTDAAAMQPTQGFAAEAYVLSQDRYQIELMNNLDKVPEAGAIIFATVPKPKDGSGFPARVFAITPKP